MNICILGEVGVNNRSSAHTTYHKGPSKKIVNSMGLLCYYFVEVQTKNNSLEGLFCSF